MTMVYLALALLALFAVLLSRRIVQRRARARVRARSRGGRSSRYFSVNLNTADHASPPTDPSS